MEGKETPGEKKGSPQKGGWIVKKKRGRSPIKGGGAGGQIMDCVRNFEDHT